MENATRARGGAVLLATAELRNPTENRPILQANETMKRRLKLLLWGLWFMEARHG